MLADAPISAGHKSLLRTSAVRAGFTIIDDSGASTVPRHLDEAKQEHESFPRGFEELFSQRVSAVHTDADEMPPVTSIWELLDSGLKPGGVQPR